MAVLLDTTLRAYQYYEHGDRKPPWDVIARLSSMSGKSNDWIMTGRGPEDIVADFKKDFPGGIPGSWPAELESVKVYGPVGAGTAKEIWDRPIGEIYVLKQLHKPGMNAVLVAGNSMEPTIMDRAYALCIPGQQDIIDNKIYVVYLRDIGNVLKRLYRAPGKIILKSDNPSVPEMEADPKEIIIQGKVVGTMQEF